MEPYVPQLNYAYPGKLDEHMMKIKVTHERILDEHYRFLNRSPLFQFFRGVIYFAIFAVVFPLNIIRFGLKIEGRNILRKHRKLFKNGAMTVSNHIHRWDFLFIVQAIRYRTIYFPAWKENFTTSDEMAVRLVGGIPIPTDIHVIKYFNQAFDEVHRLKKWIHAFPESAMFYYFQPIRPFKKGVFTMAYRYNMPVIPMAFSYRKPRFPYTLVNLFRTVIGRQKVPMITLRIGEPILPDTTLSCREGTKKLRKECHEAIVRLAGITNNPYSAESELYD